MGTIIKIEDEYILARKNRESKIRLSDKLISFLCHADYPGSIMVVFDEGEGFCRRYNEDLYAVILDYIMQSLSHIKVRVGGNSFRVADAFSNRMFEKGYPLDRFENLDCGMSYLIPENPSKIDMCKIPIPDFKPIVEYAEAYDFRNSMCGQVIRSTVWQYVNNVDSGFYDESGQFHEFGDKLRGLCSLTDVAMVKGLKHIKPATAALFSDSRLAIDGANARRREAEQHQERLCADSGIPLFNIADERVTFDSMNSTP